LEIFDLNALRKIPGKAEDIAQGSAEAAKADEQFKTQTNGIETQTKADEASAKARKTSQRQTTIHDFFSLVIS
jgi:hypothetical protein